MSYFFENIEIWLWPLSVCLNSSTVRLKKRGLIKSFKCVVNVKVFECLKQIWLNNFLYFIDFKVFNLNFMFG